MDLSEISLFVGKKVNSINKDSKSLTLSFEKKVLFIKKNVKFVISAMEDISNLSIKDTEGDTLKAVSYAANRIKLVFSKEGVSSTYAISFKASSISKTK